MRPLTLRPEEPARQLVQVGVTFQVPSEPAPCTGSFKRPASPWGALLIALNTDLGEEARQGSSAMLQCQGDSQITGLYRPPGVPTSTVTAEGPQPALRAVFVLVPMPSPFLLFSEKRDPRGPTFCGDSSEPLACSGPRSLGCPAGPQQHLWQALPWQQWEGWLQRGQWRGKDGECPGG